MARLYLLSVILLLQGPQACLAVRRLRFASPLQSLTIPDPEIQGEEDLNTPRKRFLPKFLAGLSAEVQARKEVAQARSRSASQLSPNDVSGSDWAEKAAAFEKERRKREDSLIESAYDQAVAGVDSVEKTLDRASKFLNQSRNEFQFVGVINRKAAQDPKQKPITWYARKKPQSAKWSVRLVHVNQDAIIKDLFNRGKVDIFAKYKNTGAVDEETKVPIVTSTYEVRERSWKNMWNFSPKHFFTDPSGAYWRERRLQPGLYTDGTSVYESSYRYRDGRNGMHRVSTLQQYLGSRSINSKQKEGILKKLRESEPDIVLEL
ncbi:hypothetical protein IV203_016639 [Nitzschia inconspicua]|uniref:Uncharacterized protein n=1 Tax=Nitzschia inconspicua TaxID=303405 RepID=A0A9K3KRI5_9STRA|nr:hypothetical protein IV203_016639 [Nitzschia inconspicua]